MTKQQIKTICEADDKLQWWAMVLFAEISELMERAEHGYGMNVIWPLMQAKVAEFPQLVTQRAEEKANEQAKVDALITDRLAALEGKLLDLENSIHEIHRRVSKLEG